MQASEKLSMLKSLLGISTNSEDSLLNVYLLLSEKSILNRLYPLADTADKVIPDKYEVLQVRIAEFMYLKKGAEGETVHKENGIDRTYSSADIPESLLCQVVPFAKVM